MVVSGYLLISQKTINMEDKKLQLMKEERIKRFKTLIGLNEDVEFNTVDAEPKQSDYDEIAEKLRSIYNSIQPNMDDHMTSIVRMSVKILAERVLKMGSMKKHMGESEVAVSTNSNVFPELDEYVDRLTLGVQNLITKELNQKGDDPEMPYKAEYIVNGLIKGLQTPLA